MQYEVRFGEDGNETANKNNDEISVGRKAMESSIVQGRKTIRNEKKIIIN